VWADHMSSGHHRTRLASRETRGFESLSTPPASLFHQCPAAQPDKNQAVDGGLRVGGMRKGPAGRKWCYVRLFLVGFDCSPTSGELFRKPRARVGARPGADSR